MSNPYSLNIAKYSTHSIISRCIGNNKKVLDVGCNTGYLGLISDPSNLFYGLEFSEEALSEAKGTYKDAQWYDLENLDPLPWDEQFNTIVFADVLEHVRNPSKVLQFFSGYLEKGGKIILSLPNVANWAIRIRLLFGDFTYTETGILDKTHLKLYTFHSARELVTLSGFKIIKTFSGASFFGPMISWFPFLGGLLATNIIFICEK